MTTAAAEETDETTENSEHLQEQIRKVGTLMHRLSKDPKHRRKVLELLKEASPETSIPELDIEEAADRRADEKVKPIHEQMKALTAELGALKTTLARERWQLETGLDSDEIDAVETLAKEKGITKATTAVEFYRALGTPRGTRRNKTADEYLGKLSKINPRNVGALKAEATAQANRVLTEMRSGRMAG